MIFILSSTLYIMSKLFFIKIKLQYITNTFKRYTLSALTTRVTCGRITGKGDDTQTPLMETAIVLKDSFRLYEYRIIIRWRFCSAESGAYTCLWIKWRACSDAY